MKRLSLTLWRPPQVILALAVSLVIGVSDATARTSTSVLDTGQSEAAYSLAAIDNQQAQSSLTRTVVGEANYAVFGTSPAMSTFGALATTITESSVEAEDSGTGVGGRSVIDFGAVPEFVGTVEKPGRRYALDESAIGGIIGNGLSPELITEGNFAESFIKQGAVVGMTTVTQVTIIIVVDEGVKKPGSTTLFSTHGDAAVVGSEYVRRSTLGFSGAD